MTTQKQVKANRENAKKSTGARTAEGRARAALNACKHGMTAKHMVVFDEDPANYESMLIDWHEEFPKSGVVEQALIESAMHSTFLLRRCRKFEASAMSLEMRHAYEEYDTEDFCRVQELGRKLKWDPLNRCTFLQANKETMDSIFKWLEDHPPTIVRQLKSTLNGINWLMSQWHELLDILDREGYWHYPEKYFAVRLLGRCQHDMLNDFPVGIIFAACNVAHPRAWDFLDECIQANRGISCRPPYFERVDYLRQFRPPTKEAARDILRRVANTELENLEVLRNRYALPDAERDAIEVTQAAMFKNVPQLSLCLRYTANAQRELHRSINGLLKVCQAERALECQENVTGNTQAAVAEPEPTAVAPTEALVEQPSAPKPKHQPSQIPNEPNSPPTDDTLSIQFDLPGCQNGENCEPLRL